MHDAGAGQVDNAEDAGIRTILIDRCELGILIALQRRGRRLRSRAGFKDPVGQTSESWPPQKVCGTDHDDL